MNEEIRRGILGQPLSSAMVTALLLLVVSLSSVSTQSLMDVGAFGDSVSDHFNTGICGPGQLFCAMRRRCVNLDGTPVAGSCETDNGSDDWGRGSGDWWSGGGDDNCHGDSCSQCQPDETFCIMHKRCVKRKNIVDDSCPNVDDDSSHGSDHGGWDGDWGPDREGEGQCYGDSCTVCEPGKVFCMMRQQCVSLQPVDASSCSQDDHGSDHGDDDGGRGDWGLGGDDDHCHGDSCTVCGKGEVFCIMNQRCMKLGHVSHDDTCPDDDDSDRGSGYSGWDGDWGLGGDDDHCHGDSCTVCGSGEVFCIMNQRCMKLGHVSHDDTCPDDDDSDHGSGDGGWDGDWGLGGDDDHCHCDSCTVCGSGEVFCIMNQRCMKLGHVSHDDTCPDDDDSDHGSEDGGWDGDWGLGGDEGHCHGDSCTVCEPGEVFCIMNQRCMKLGHVSHDDTCPDDDDSDYGSGDGDWGSGGDEGHCHGDSCTVCEPGEVFCIMNQRCMKLGHVSHDDTCPDDRDSDHGSGDGGWDGDWGLGSDEGHCHGDSCTVCEPGEVFCIMNQRCMKLGHVSHDDICPDDDDRNHGSGDGSWDGDWGLGGDEGHCHGDSCTVCEPGEVFCIMNQRCMKLGHVSHDDTCPYDSDSDHGSGDGGWDGDWGLGGDESHCHGYSCTVCEHGEVFCIMNQRCIKLGHVSHDDTCPDDSDSDNGSGDGGWDGDWGLGSDEGHCHGDSCTVCEPGEVFCIMNQRCMKLGHVSHDDTCPDDDDNDHGSGDGSWDGDWGLGGDEGHCHGDSCTVCEPGEVFCVMNQRCMKLGHVSNDDTCPDDDDDDHRSGDGGWDGDWGLGGDEGHCHGDSCTVCEPGEVFCIMNKRCMKLGHVSHDDTCPDAGDSDHGSGYSGWDGDWGLGGDEVHCHGDSCTVCDPGEVFCVMRKKCVPRQVEVCTEPPEGTCPAPSSTVFEGRCNDGQCGTDGRCDEGKICCYSNHCGGDVCVMPEETQRGTCPAVDPTMMGVCGGPMFCQNDTECAAEGKICCDSACGGKMCVLSLEDMAPEGTCPAPSSNVFEELCNHGPCHTDGGCDGGKICCPSDHCGGDVCVMPEETPRGTCPVVDPAMMGPCGGNMCQNDTECAAEGKICCDSACGGKMCVLPLEDMDDGGHSGWEPPDTGDDEPVCREENGCHQCGKGQLFCVMRQACVDVAVLEPCPCPDGQVWIEDERKCETPEVPEPDLFFLTIKPDSEFDYYLGTNPNAISKERVVSRLDQLAGHIRTQLDNQLISRSGAGLVEAGAQLDWVAVYPTLGGEDGKGVQIWAKISVDEDAVSLEDLEAMLSGLVLTSLGEEAMNFEHKLYEVSDDPINTFFITDPLVRGERRDIDIGALIPAYMREQLPQDMRETFPTHVSLSCEEEHKVFFIDPTTDGNVRSITVEGARTIVTMTQTDDDIKRVECSIIFQELLHLDVNTTTYQLGLFLLPADLSELARIDNIALLEPGMMIYEDDGCQPFPDQMFEITFRGDVLVNKHHDWVRRMIDKGELWLSPNLHVDIELLLADYVAKRALSLRKARSAEVKISESTRYDENNRLVATLTDVSKNQPKDLKADGQETNLLETREYLKICVAPDFFGSFEIEIRPSLQYGSTSPLIFSVEVIPTNDAPEAKDNIEKLIKSQEVFVYPPVDPDATVKPPEVLAADIVNTFYSDDKDKNTDLVMGLLGYTESYIEDEVVGIWEYADAEGSTWHLIPLYEVPEATGEDEFEVAMMVLPPTALIKFQPSSEDESRSWRLSVAPKIAFLAVDDPGMDLVSMVTLHYCNTGSKKLCGPGVATNFSEAIVDMPLLRVGCDGVIDSGSLNINSACPCDTAVCPDCADIQGGDSFIDACGNCNAPADAVTTWAECPSDDDDEEPQCDPGFVADVCSVCLATGSDLSGLNECDFPCSDYLPCLDCNGVPNGDSVYNLCGNCTSLENFFEGCPVEIGKIYPESQYIHAMSQVSVHLSDSLKSTPVDEILCVLDSLVTGTVAPQVTSVEYASSSSIAVGTEQDRDSRLLLFLEVPVADNVQDSAGQFDVICSFGQTTVALSDSGDNAVYYTRFRHPTVVDIDPAEAFISEVGEVELTVDGLVDTGIVYCVIPCEGLSNSVYCHRTEDGAAYYVVKGTIVDASAGTLTCNLVIMKKLRSGKIVDINIILDHPKKVDMTSLPPPTVQYTVKMPAPSLVSARTDWQGCGNVTVEFSTYIRANDGPCTNFFTVTGSTLTSDVTCVVIGKTIVMVFGHVPVLSAGTQLALVEGVVYDANSENLDIRSYSAGSVVVEAANMVLINKSVPRVTVGITRRSLVMPNCDTWDRFFYQYLTLIKVKFGYFGFSMGKKEKTVDFSETIAACDLKSGRCRQLIEIMKIQPDVSISGPTEIGPNQDYIIARIENRGCLQFDLTWTVAAAAGSPSSEVTAKVDELNSHLNSLDEREKRRIRIIASQFISGEAMLFTLTWTAQNFPAISGAVSHSVTRDDSKVIGVKIQHNSGNNVDRNKRHRFSANIKMALDQSDPDATTIYEWQISPSVSGLKEKKNRLTIKANMLKAKQEYRLHVKVTYTLQNTAYIANDSVTFITKSKPLTARISSNGKSDTEVPVSILEDVVLRSQGKDQDGSDDPSYYRWTVETNQYSASPDDDTAFSPLREIGDDGTAKNYQRYTESIELLASERNTAVTNLRYRVTLKWRKGDRNATAMQILNFQRVVYEPEIIRRRSDADDRSQEIIYVRPKAKNVLLYRKCKAMTKHSWTSTEGYPPIKMSDITMDKHMERIKIDYYPAKEKLRRCYIWLDFTKEEAQQYINGETYGLTLTAFSGSDLVTETFLIKTYVAPIAGIVEVKEVDSSILSGYKAHETEFEMILYDWWDHQDDTKLYCLYYYRETTSRRWEKIFTHEEPYEPMMARTFTLREGIFEFKAKCRNSAKLSSSMESENIIEVEPVDLVQEETSNTVVRMALYQLQIMPEQGPFVMMSLFSYMAVITSTASLGYITSVQAVVTTHVNVVIADIIPTEDDESDPDDAFGAIAEANTMYQSMDSSTKSAVTTSSRVSMLSAALVATREATGMTEGSSRRRKRREVVQYCATGDQLGMSVENSVVTLETIETVGSDPATLSEDGLAEDILELMEIVMVGLCQSYSEDGSEPVDAIASELGVRLLKPVINSSLVIDILHENYTSPATLYYGSNFETMYSSSQDCGNETTFCPPDVCVATSQFDIDFISETASLQIVVPTRYSDIIMIKFYDPDTSCEKQAAVSSDPVLITVTTTATDLTDFDLLCMMWVSDNWDADPCTTGVPTLNGGVYDVICSCTQFGILGVFETAKSNDTYETLTVPTTTAATTTAKPSISLQALTVSVTCRLSLFATYSNQIGRFTFTVLRDHLKQKFSEQTGIAVNLIDNFLIAEGSIVITFDLYPSSTSGSDTLGQMLWTIENMVETGTLALTNPDGDVLPVNVTSFTYTEQSSSTSDTDGDDGKTDSTGAIVGAVIGALVIIGLGVAAGIFYYKKYYTKSMRTNATPSPPPSPAPLYKSSPPPVFGAYNTHFSMTPPPYRAVQTPTKDKLYPKVEKWTENELKPVHAPLSVINDIKVEGASNVVVQEEKVGDVKKLEDMLETPQRSKTTITIGSTSSLELQVRQPTPEERCPTPVDH